MAAPILWVPGILGSFCRKTPMPMKYPRFTGAGGGGVGFFFEGRAEVPILFLWAPVFLIKT